jgi:hypothetical protein
MTRTEDESMPSVGERLLTALYEADERCDAARAGWATLPGSSREAAAAFYDELHAANDERAAAACQLWGYMEGEPRGHYDGPERPTAEELAAWAFLQDWKYRRPHGGRHD